MTEAIAVQEKPILFSGEMIRAILAGRKTQTRRVMKRNTPFERNGEFEWYPGGEKAGFHAANGPSSQFSVPSGWAAEWCPYGKPGDRLWVRHGFWFYKSTGANPGNVHIWDEFTRTARWQTGEVIEDCELDKTGPLYVRKPSIHMPRWASRLTLEIVSVKVERVQDISFEDCLAEGVIWTEHWDKVKGAEIEEWAKKHPKGLTIDESISHSWEDYARIAFKGLWDSINAKREDGKYAWDKNPWIWAITFQRVAGGERA